MLYQFQVAVRIPAPPEHVFGAFVDPDKAAKWYCSEEMVPEEIVTDVRVGGRYKATMRILNETFAITGEFKEVIPNQKLVFTQVWHDLLMHETLTTVLFRPRDGETDVLVTQENFKNEDDADVQRTYWTNALKGLAIKVAEGVI